VTETVRLLVVTAVAAERDAVVSGLAPDPFSPVEHALPGRRVALRVTSANVTADVLAAGVGPAAAAAGCAAALAAAELGGQSYDLVVCAGIGGGFEPAAPPVSVVVADSIVAADLGAETGEGFTPVAELGFGVSVHRSPARLSRAVAQAMGAVHGPVLTVSTVTGTAARATELAARHPGAAAEGMEGFGVAEAAGAHGVPALEIRTVSNPVGPRDRGAWRIGEALAALTEACGKLPSVLDVEHQS
jgi:futalosine hydrolase